MRRKTAFILLLLCGVSSASRSVRIGLGQSSTEFYIYLTNPSAVPQHVSITFTSQDAGGGPNCTMTKTAGFAVCDANLQCDAPVATSRRCRDLVTATTGVPPILAANGGAMCIAVNLNSCGTNSAMVNTGVMATIDIQEDSGYLSGYWTRQSGFVTDQSISGGRYF